MSQMHRFDGNTAAINAHLAELERWHLHKCNRCGDTEEKHEEDGEGEVLCASCMDDKWEVESEA